MSLAAVSHLGCYHSCKPISSSLLFVSACSLNDERTIFIANKVFQSKMCQLRPKISSRRASSTSIKLPQRKCLGRISATSAGVPLPPLDLTEDNIEQVLVDARTEFGQIFDTSVGMTGKVELAELDGPFVKISLKGRFWHERSLVLARVGNYLKQRIPEILEVDIQDEKQLDDSPENF